VLSAPFVDDDGVAYETAVALHWLWQGHETGFQTAPPYSWVWSDAETASGEYYFLLPGTHADGSAVNPGDTLLFYLDGEDGFGNYSAHALYQLRAGDGFLGARDAAPRVAAYALAQNYPNPFNATTTIGYSLPRAMLARLAVYNLLGQQVAVLAEGMQSAGEHRVTWNGGNAAAGVYIYRLETDSETLTRKLLLLK
jgi:hypothetical protein